MNLLTLVRTHPASDYEIKGKARKLWEKLAAELSPEMMAEAEARGRALDLGETAAGLVGE